MTFFQKFSRLFLCILAVTVSGMFSAQEALASQQPKVYSGLASWYKAIHGKKTASGEGFNAAEFTAAHPSLPLGTLIRVTRPETKKSVVVRINDRCRCTLDLSPAAAMELGLIRAGRAQVSFVVDNTAARQQPLSSLPLMFEGISITPEARNTEEEIDFTGIY